ncbi:MAG: S-layer homology domain-containing protein [Tissierellia bacterium]|nr:S-layer homology domain-containing protein [Tissierellia bacterium]
MVKKLPILVTLLLVLVLLPGPIFAEELTYDLATFEEFKETVDAINRSPSKGPHIIRLTEDIVFDDADYRPSFKKDTVILGQGHTLNLGGQADSDSLSNSFISVGNGASLSLGREGGSKEENQLTITARAKKRYNALLVISEGTLNLYEGVEVTGSHINGTTLFSAINITSGNLNMYGGDIHGNTTDALPGRGSAVGGAGYFGPPVFNMFGGTIRDNQTLLNGNNFVYGGGVFLAKGSFTMTGGSIHNNQTGLGGGLLLKGSDCYLKGGQIVDNECASYGGGIASMGQGCLEVQEGFVLANNRAALGGDDLVHLNLDCLHLAPACKMETQLTTDGSHKDITGWYLDRDPRWQADTAQEVDISQPLDGPLYLKAAYGPSCQVAYCFLSGSPEKPLPQEVLDLLPQDDQVYDLGDQVSPIQPTKTQVSLCQGTWTFAGYDAQSKTIQSPTTEFVGTWIFKAQDQTLGGSSRPSPKPCLENHPAYLRGYKDQRFGPDQEISREEVAALFARLVPEESPCQARPKTAFMDLEPSRWSSKAISQLSGLGLIEGYPDGTFRPQDPISRAEFLALATRFRPLEPGGPGFKDVPETHWAQAPIQSASAAGWIEGYPDGTFRPDQGISRAEVVKIVNKILGREADQTFIDLNKKDLSIYRDLKEDHWAYYPILEGSLSHQAQRDSQGKEVWKKVDLPKFKDQ